MRTGCEKSGLHTHPGTPAACAHLGLVWGWQGREALQLRGSWGLRWAGNIHPICLRCTCPTCCYLRHSEERNCIEQATFSRLLMQHNSGTGPVSTWGPAKAMLRAGWCLPARNVQLTSPFPASAQPSSGKAATPPKADAVFTGQGFLQISEVVVCSRERQLQLVMFIAQQKLVCLLSL